MKAHRKKYPSLFIAVVVLAVALALSLYHWSARPSAPPHQSSVNMSVPNTLSSLNTTLKKKFSYLATTSTVPQNTTGYELPGYNFQVIMPNDSGDIVSWKDQSTNDETAQYRALDATVGIINNSLESRGFSQAPSSSSSNGLLSAIYFYQRSDAICQVTVYSLLVVNCAPTAQLRSIAQQADPLVQAYMAAAPGTEPDAITAPVIQASKSPNYTVALLAVFNSVGQTNVNFYKQGTATWQLVNLNWYNDPHENGQPTPNCADFESNSAVKQAFLGVACYDSALRIASTIQ